MEEIISVRVKKNRTIIIECIIDGKLKNVELTFEVLQKLVGDVLNDFK